VEKKELFELLQIPTIQTVAKSSWVAETTEINLTRVVVSSS